MKSNDQRIFISKDTVAYNEFLRTKEKKNDNNRRIDRLELMIEQLEKRISALERVKE